MSNIVVMSADSCTDAGGVVYKFCLPVKEICMNTCNDSLLTAEGERWNCNYCASDKEYYIPYIAGDKIQIQTLSYDSVNSDRTNPTLGYTNLVTAVLKTCDGSMYSVNQFASRRMLAYGCKRSYQVVEIDTGMIAGEDAFYVEFEDANGIICQTHEFAKINPATCPETFTIGSVKDEGKSCSGYCYGEPDAYVGDLILFDNTIRLRGYWKKTGGNVQFNKVGNKVNQTTVRDSYIIQTGEKVPPFIETYLRKEILSAKHVVVDGTINLEIDDFNIENDLDNGRMFFFDVDLFSECVNSEGCK